VTLLMVAAHSPPIPQPACVQKRKRYSRSAVWTQRAVEQLAFQMHGFVFDPEILTRGLSRIVPSRCVQGSVRPSLTFPSPHPPHPPPPPPHPPDP